VAATPARKGGTFVEPLGPTLDLNLVSNCEDGSSRSPGSPLPQVGESRGLYVGWEFSGLGRVSARALESGAALDLRVGNLPDFKTDVEPGETFLAPPAFVGCYTGDLDDGSYTLHRWVIEKLRPPVPRGFADPTAGLQPLPGCRRGPRPGGGRSAQRAILPRPRLRNLHARRDVVSARPATGAGTRNGFRTASGRLRHSFIAAA